MKFSHLVPVFIFAILLSACGVKKATTPSTTSTSGVKLLVNELAMSERPFLVLVPHATNKLFTFVALNANKANSAVLDLEYTSGDLLKGARATLESPIANPYVKAIILGSCSTGGKCTFDTDLKSGTMKLKLVYSGKTESHVLKEDFTFVTGQNNLPDGKVTFAPAKASAKQNLILMNSSGLPKVTSKEIVLYPIILSSADDKNIVGTLTVNQTGVTGAAIYDGQNYQDIKYTEKDGVLTFNLNNKPWSMAANIIRDDQKGTTESLNLYILGPIVLYK